MQETKIVTIINLMLELKIVAIKPMQETRTKIVTIINLMPELKIVTINPMQETKIVTIINLML